MALQTPNLPPPMNFEPLLIIELALLGLGTGFLAGLLGIGGGMLMVPFITIILSGRGVGPDLSVKMAIATSMATIIFTSINAVLEHQRKGAVRWELVRWMTLGILLGAGVGALTAAAIQGPQLQKIIGVFALVIAVQMALELKPKASAGVPGKSGLTLAGVVIGWASAIFGIGGGSLSVPFLTWRSVPMQQAVATSSACGLPRFTYLTRAAVSVGSSGISK